LAQVARARIAGDWQAIEQAARGSSPVRVYRTGFDRQGLHACLPVGAPPVRPEDVLRWAYRAMWLALLEEMPLPEPRPGNIGLAPFGALLDHARVGRQLAGRLRAAVSERVPSLALVERLGREIEALDRAIVEHGEIHPDVAVLTQM